MMKTMKKKVHPAVPIALVLGLIAFSVVITRLTPESAPAPQPAAAPVPRYTLAQAIEKQEQVLLENGIDARVTVSGSPPVVRIYGPWNRVLAYRALKTVGSIYPWIRLGTWSELGARKVLLVGPNSTWACELRGANWHC